MRLSAHPPRHLTYCLNIHPGESLAAVTAALREHAVAVRNMIFPAGPFGVGLRISAQAARELSDPAALESFRGLLREHRFYAFTINGFPYGAFHGTRVKEQVYRPDWQTEARRDYTNQLADLLAALLPDGMPGSISTVPGSFAPWMTSPAAKTAAMQRLVECAAHLAALEERTGREILVGLEPEPGCALETAGDFVAFFNDLILARGIPLLAALRKTGRGQAEGILRRHLGICLDACHMSVAFEDPDSALDQLQDEGIRVAKIQLSAGLRLVHGTHDLKALRDFAEPVYFHQVKARRAGGAPRSWNDLPDALGDLRDSAWDEVRVHYHVPLFWSGTAALGTTRELVPALLRRTAAGDLCPHLEIETYTFEVLPAALRGARVSECISREYEWVASCASPA